MTATEAPTRGRSKMSEAHKKALAEGREHGKVVNAYLEALEVHRPRRGRKVTPETLRERIADVEQRLQEAKGAERLVLIQKRIDLQDQLRRSEDTTDLEELEAKFIQVVKPYAERRNITYAALREAGVSTDVLKSAGFAKAA